MFVIHVCVRVVGLYIYIYIYIYIYTGIHPGANFGKHGSPMAGPPIPHEFKRVLYVFVASCMRFGVLYMPFSMSHMCVFI